MVTPMLRKFFMWALSLGALMGLAGLVGLFMVVQHFSIDLPDYKQLANYQPAITTRVHAGDGRLMEEQHAEKGAEKAEGEGGRLHGELRGKGAGITAHSPDRANSEMIRG